MVLASAGADNDSENEPGAEDDSQDESVGGEVVENRRIVRAGEQRRIATVEKNRGGELQLRRKRRRFSKEETRLCSQRRRRREEERNGSKAKMGRRINRREVKMGD